jgi:ATP-binding cassette subfamily B protein
VLLLDEATSALDPAAEASINDTVERLRAHRTIVMVTHRLSSARSADRIVVFASGRVAEVGTHAELMAKGGAYRALWDKQSGVSLLHGGDQAVVASDRLRALPLFADLDAATLTELATYFGTEHYAEGRDVLQQGDHGDRFYIVARGRLLVTKHDAAGEAVEVATLTDGDHFGEIALLRDDRRNATVRTLSPSVLLSLSRTHFMRLIQREPALRARVEADLIARG